MSKQSAIEWLVEEIHKNGEEIHRNGNWIPTHMIKKAKQMEKEQIEEAWDEGQECEYQYHINAAPKYNSNTYYNETYGGAE
jgi:hypothetical protein